MFKLIAATLGAMYLIALSVGDAPVTQPEAQDVARAADPAFETTFVSLVGAAEASTAEVSELSMTDAEAIELALATGQEMRRDRAPAAPLLGTAASQALVASAEAATPSELWSVTGSTVNLRSGPGTANGVVAKLTLGTEAEVLEEGNGWYRIRTADGAVDGWIFGKYLSKNG